MAKKRNYKVKGTKDYLVMAVIFFFLGIWAIKDGWYPSKKVLKKHPITVEEAFDSSGIVESVNVSVGDSIGEDFLLATLKTDAQKRMDLTKKKGEKASKAYAKVDQKLRDAIKNDTEDSLISSFKEQRDVLRKERDQAQEDYSVAKEDLEKSQLFSTAKGVVTEVLISKHSVAEMGSPVILLDPQDHFYLFNKSLAIFCSIAFVLFMGIHIKGS